MLAEVLAAIEPKPGEVAVDATLGGAGHARELLRRVTPGGRLFGLDLDPANLEPARALLSEIGGAFSLHHANFAGLQAILGAEGVRADAVIVDLGMSSMQVDDANRGFSFVRDGPLDMRMDSTRGRTAAQLLASLSESELASAFRDLGDEPHAEKIAAAIVAYRSNGSISRTVELARLIQEAAPVTVIRGPGQATPRQQQIRPTARVFQALRILVNRELANLQAFLRFLPDILAPSGRAAIISFHSGEDRLVKNAFREGMRSGIFISGSDEPIRASAGERYANPRSRSAKLRWIRRA
jgi:16S rRNA (cytosine1402-N4)-methyltransferase